MFKGLQIKLEGYAQAANEAADRLKNKNQQFDERTRWLIWPMTVVTFFGVVLSAAAQQWWLTLISAAFLAYGVTTLAAKPPQSGPHDFGGPSKPSPS